MWQGVLHILILFSSLMMFMFIVFLITSKRISNFQVIALPRQPRLVSDGVLLSIECVPSSGYMQRWSSAKSCLHGRGLTWEENFPARVL